MLLSPDKPRLFLCSHLGRMERSHEKESERGIEGA